MTQPDPATDAADIAALQRVIERLPQRAGPWVRASENGDHIGALLADAALQPGLDYRSVVEPRVRRIAREYPAASSISGLLEILAKQDVKVVLGIVNVRKCAVFHSLAQLLQGESVETVSELRSWLGRSESRSKLLAIHGVGTKTASYLKLLVGLPAIAIDVHLRRAAETAGVHRSDEDLERLFGEAAAQAGVPLAALDGALWQQGNDRRRRGPD